MKHFNPEHPEIKARVVIRHPLAFAFLSIMPIVPGHTLICPVRVVESSDDLSPEEWSAILEVQRQLCDALRKAFGAEGFNFAWNMGEHAGQTVPHFHLHVVPRQQGDAGILHYEPRVFLYRPGSRAPSPAEELRQTAEQIRAFLQPL